MNYMKKFLQQCNEECKEGSEFETDSVMWEFCAPAHGKGPWDGVGAVIKRLLRELERTGMKDGKTIYNRTAFDCFLTLQQHYEDWTKDISERYCIDKFNFFYIPENNSEAKEISSSQDEKVEKSRARIMVPIKRPQTKMNLTQLKGIRSEYFCFLAEADKNARSSKNESVVAARFLSCRCSSACLTSSANANRKINSNLNRLF